MHGAKVDIRTESGLLKDVHHDWVVAIPDDAEDLEQRAPLRVAESREGDRRSPGEMLDARGAPAAGAPGGRGVARRPVVIIDGPNVGRSHNLGWKSPHGFDYAKWAVQRKENEPPPLCASAVVAAVDFWREKGYEVKVLLPERFLGRNSHHLTLGVEELTPLIGAEVLVQTP